MRHFKIPKIVQALHQVKMKVMSCFVEVGKDGLMGWAHLPFSLMEQYSLKEKTG